MTRKIGALWCRKSKDGKEYMSGILEDLSGNIRIAVFKNDRKEHHNQPDYQIILSGEHKEQKEPVSQQAEEAEIDVSKIPF